MKRRLGIPRDLCSEYKLTLSVQWICSDKNKADYLTRVPKRWIDASAKRAQVVTMTLCLAGVTMTLCLYARSRFRSK